MAIEIVSFPLKMVIFHSYVKLPEGKTGNKIPISHGEIPFTYPLVN